MSNVENRSIPFSPPDISDIEINEVIDTLKSGWITTGPKTKELERRLANYIGTERVVCLNSQTSAAELSLRVLGIGPDDEVITCAYTYTATASVISHVGAKVVMIDCQKNSLEMDYDALEAAINEKTKAIIAIDIAGIPCDYDRIYSVIERKRELFQPSSNNDLGWKIQNQLGRIVLISDAAHALGAKYRNKMVGSIADFTNYSFHAVKNLTTGEGGAITWKTIEGISSEVIYKQLQLYSLHGQNKDALSKMKLGAWEYNIEGPWYKYNMTDIAASLGLGQLSRYPKLLKKRREIIESYDKALKPIGIEVLQHYSEKHTSSGHLYITRIPGIDSIQRNEIIEKMAEKGVSTNVHYKPLPMHTAYIEMGFRIEDYPNAYLNYSNEITLPLHTKLSEEDVNYIIETYTEIVGKYIK